MIVSVNVSTRFEEIAEVFLKAAQSTLPAKIEELAGLLVAAFQNGRKLLVFGNGGSASDAAASLRRAGGPFSKESPGSPALALCCDSAVVTACGNDFSFNDIFARQIQALGLPGDVALGISTSGNSPNVTEGLAGCAPYGLSTVLLTGPQPGRAAEFCDLVLAAPAPCTARIQELHLAAITLCAN